MARIAVTGATGNVGAALVRLLADGGHEVAAISRHQRPTAEPADDTVRSFVADLADPASLTKALDGVDALFLLVAGDDAHGVLDVAKRSGVGHVVLLSSQGARTRPRSYPHPVAFEDAVRTSGLGWTILRPSGFATNAFQWVPGVRSARTVEAPFVDVALPVVDPADLAAVVARVLSDVVGGAGAHDGAAYTLTGPAAISPRDQAAAIGLAIGDAVRVVELDRDEALARMSAVMPPAVADATLDLLGRPTADEAAVSTDVGRLLGRPASSFAEWATRNAPAFR
ncbi:NAD(P)H-binding protein [Luteimicrobium sp. NPDC057192]|uniref:NAD(P)H-binding protein n=1 Tax=Luteimicrobium sp. NPDC057192 TaxID=3346042 RepID=UPI00362E87FB